VGHVTNMINAFEVRGATLTGNVVIEPRPNVIFMNQRAFSALSAAQQRVLIRAASQARAEAGVYEPDGTSVQQMCRAGTTIVTASRVDLAGLRAAVQPVYRKLESNPATKAFIAQITAMRQAVGGAPDAVSCPAGSGGSSQITTTATKLDGKWQVTFTESQLLAAGPEPSEDQPANYGHFISTFERGHWWQAGPPGTNGSSSGTYVVRGNEITFYRNDHSYRGSDTETWGPYIWSVYRDTLTLKKARWSVRDQGPTSLVVKPWRKIGA